MSRIIYVNGQYLPSQRASISALDRGFHFGDGVYEVTAVFKGQLLDNESHLKRLFSSLEKIRLTHDFHGSSLEVIMKTVVLKNRIDDGIVYVGISRGSAVRDHPFPKNTPPTVICFAKRLNLSYDERKGVSAITMEDMRWKRCDIKSLNLLGNVLAKQTAKEHGSYEVFFVNEDNQITECSLSNAWMVNANNELQTHPITNGILNGITRQHILNIAQKLNIPVKEVPFTKEEAYGAKELFVSSTTGIVLSVVKLDEYLVGDGKPGPISIKLRSAYLEFIDSSIGF